jgi:hypothetical protein
MLPDYLIIGSMRCGTTYIARNLATHPQVYMPKAKEVHFFDRDYDLGLEHYQSYFPGPSESSRYAAIGEATPAYLYFEQVPARIRKHLPNVRMIASLRNPIDTAYSMYWKAYSTDERTRKMTFEQKLEVEPRMLEGGKYYQQLARYLELFPRDQFHFLLYEDMVKSPLAEFSRMFAFLGVDENFEPLYLRNQVNASAVRNGRFATLHQAHRLIIKHLRLPWAARFLEAINRKSVPPMASKTRNYLRSVFEAPNRQLEDLLGRDLSEWR